MLKRGNTKGLSTIVATLIIILLVLVAVGIIWVVIRNVIQQGSEQVSLGKFTLDLKIEQVQVISDNQLNVKVKRNAGAGEFVSLKFIIEDGSNSEVIELNSSLKELEERIFNINLAEVNASNLQKISIAPVFRLESGREITGDVKDEFEIAGPSCTPNCAGRQCGGDGCGGSCGSCVSGQNCQTNGTCTVIPCTDTCTSLGYSCGTRVICGASVNCGTCASGSTCQTNGTCIVNPPVCTDTCASLGYQCGTRTVCGASVNCGTCQSGFTCQTNGTCINQNLCGNGVINSGEQCDGSQLGGATCASVMGAGYTGTLTCTGSCIFNTNGCVAPQTQTTIFVTSVTYLNGSIGGLAGADSRCQTLANTAGLGGTWRAWMGDLNTNASQRLTHSTSDYRLRNGTIVANGWSDLTDGNLDNPINRDENGNAIARTFVFTGTNSTGFTFGGDSGRYCFDWTSPSAGWSYGGYTDQYLDYQWTTRSPSSCTPAACGGAGCSTPFRIYCLRQ